MGIDIFTDKCGHSKKADTTEVSLVDEIVGPAGISDEDCRGNTNGPPSGSSRKSSLSPSTLMRRLNEAAETV